MLDVVKEVIELRKQVAYLTYDNTLLQQKDKHYQKLKKDYRKLQEKYNEAIKTNKRIVGYIKQNSNDVLETIKEAQCEKKV